MIKWVIALVLLLNVSQVQAQKKETPVRDSITQEIFASAEQMPEFPGDLYSYFRNNIIYPQKAAIDGLEDVVYVSFVVTADGSLEDIKIKKGIFEELNEEAIRVVKSMPKWIPGKQNGRNVAVYYTVPVKFVLSD